jgi:uncharacterized protein (DUF1778 family)
MNSEKQATTRRRTIWINDKLWSAIQLAASLDGRSASNFILAAVVKAIPENQRV